ncbi:hypothetical protein [Streptomyces cyaneofuscatus]|uniref:hypothetical protein n=1 Tax=Streptomyces cyaneofuscatus TaxID=66883 RepID=UPI00380F591F
MTRLTGESDWTPVAGGPLGIHQAVEDVRCPLGGFFQGCAHRFEYQLQAVSAYT